MKAIIRLEVPEFQIGKEVSCYFEDTMSVNGICEKAEPCDAVNRKAAIDACLKGLNRKEMVSNIKSLPSVQPECTEDYCPAAFMPTMIYPQVEGITPTVVEPCVDVISREKAIKAIYGYSINIVMSRGIEQYKTQITDMLQSVHEAQKKLIENLPPVTPAEKVGRWIDADGDNARCGCCNRLNHLYGDYCKHCGAKMQEVDE